MPRRNRNAWRQDTARARDQEARAAGDVVKLRPKGKKRGRRDIRRAA